MAENSSNQSVTTPCDMAKLLFNASASSAAAYALASHEDACEQGDDQRVEFWREVCAELRVIRDQLDHEQARRAA